jgi:predicted dehydrogenase
MIRIGIVGCGRILAAHLHGLRILREKGVDNFRITALCDSVIENAASFRKRGEGPPPRPPVTLDPADPLSRSHLYVDDFQKDELPTLYGDYEEMLKDDVVDAVVVLTPVSAHHPVALASLKAGKHVIVEKPIAITVRAARQMVDEADRQQRVLSVAEVDRYDTMTRVNQWVLDQGYIGEVQMVMAGCIGAPPWSPNKMVAQTPWRYQKLKAGGGGAIDFGVHSFNTLRYICGEIRELVGLVRTLEREMVTLDEQGNVIDRVENEVDDVYFSTLQFENGGIGETFFCWAGHGEPFAMPWGGMIWGSKGSLGGGKITLDDGTTGQAEELFTAHASREMKQRFFPMDMRDGFALELYDFLQAVEGKKEPETSGRDGLRDLAVAYAVIESSLLGRWVEVREVESGRVEGYQQEINRYYGL